MILVVEDVSDLSDRDPVVNVVTAIAATVVALSFLFGFGNILNSLNLITACVGGLSSSSCDQSR